MCELLCQVRPVQWFSHNHKNTERNLIQTHRFLVQMKSICPRQHSQQQSTGKGILVQAYEVELSSSGSHDHLDWIQCGLLTLDILALLILGISVVVIVFDKECRNLQIPLFDMHVSKTIICLQVYRTSKTRQVPLHFYGSYRVRAMARF